MTPAPTYEDLESIRALVAVHWREQVVQSGPARDQMLWVASFLLQPHFQVTQPQPPTPAVLYAVECITQLNLDTHHARQHRDSLAGEPLDEHPSLDQHLVAVDRYLQAARSQCPRCGAYPDPHDFRPAEQWCTCLSSGEPQEPEDRQLYARLAARVEEGIDDAIGRALLAAELPSEEAARISRVILNAAVPSVLTTISDLGLTPAKSSERTVRS